MVRHLARKLFQRFIPTKTFWRVNPKTSKISQAKDRQDLEMLGEVAYSTVAQNDASPDPEQTIVSKNDFFEFYWHAQAPGLLIQQKYPSSAKPEYLSFDQGSYLITKLYEFGKAHNIAGLNTLHFKQLDLFWGLMGQANSNALGMTVNNWLFKQYFNSHLQYLGHFNQLIENGLPNYAPEQDQDRIGRYFCRVYYNEWRALAPHLKGPVDIHDCGTNIALFPALMSAFPTFTIEGEKVELKSITASDIDWTGEEYIKAIHKRQPENYPLAVHFKNIDLLGDLNEFDKCDLVFFNDVLEHLPNDEQSLKALKEVWEKARVGVVVHVPIEEEPSTIWDHFITFNVDKLREWSSHLEGARLVSDEVEDHGEKLTDQGYLIALKSH